MHASICSRSTLKLLFSALFGIALAATSAVAQDPPGSARLAHLEGNVSFQPSGEDNWAQASSNMPLGPGDRVFTDAQAQGEMQAQSVRAYFSPGTDLTLTNMNEQGVELGLASGTIFVYSDGFLPGHSLFVSTPNGGVTMSDRGNFRIDVYTDQQATVITNIRGNYLQLNGAGGFTADLAGNQSIQLSGTNPVYSQPLQPAYQDQFEGWAANLDVHRLNSPSAQYVSAEMHGYEELDGNGDWQPESEYGPIWYPHVNEGWAPYRNGHWVHMPFYGWTWVADEPWGAAPFHYGRWVNMRGRWGWIPGPRESHPVWSPAQVVFAGGVQVGGAGVSVWFPLGPGEPYHPWYPCTPEYVNRVNITNIRETRVVHTVVNYNVVNVTNITYVNRNNGVTAMRQQDFASGHQAQTNFVRVDPRQTERIQPAAPVAQAPVNRIVGHPIARPVAAAPARPVLINHQGEQAPAAPGAHPVQVPVRTVVAPPRPLPGHTAAGAPSVGKPNPVTPITPIPTHEPAQPTQRLEPNRPLTPPNNQPTPRTPTPPVTPAPPTQRLEPNKPLPPPQRPNQTPPDTRPQPPAPDTRTMRPPPTPQTQPVRPEPPATRPAPEPRPAPNAEPKPNHQSPDHPAKDQKKQDDKKPNDKKPNDHKKEDKQPQ